jgi:hypothetical protein
MPKLGLGANIGKQALTTPGIISDGLVLKSNFDTGEVTPISDGSVEFNGTSDYINMGSNSSLDNMNDGGGTFSAWINADGLGETDFPYVFWKDDKHKIRLSDESGGAVKVHFHYKWDGDDGSWYTDDRLITFGKWHHLAITYNADSASNNPLIFIDGVSVGITDSTPTGTREDDAASDFIIGGDGGGGDSFDGKICNVGVWSSVLTQAQIKSIMYKNYSGLTSSETTNLVSWWDLDEVVDSTTTTGAAVVYDKVNASLEDTPTIDSIASSNSAATSTQLGAMNKDLVSGSIYKLTLTVAKEGRIDYHHNTGATGSTVAGYPLTVGTHELYVHIDDSTVNRFLMIPYIEDQLSYIKLERILGNPGRLS